MQAEIITTPARLDEIGPAWQRLWRMCDGSVFQSHGWVRAWWAAQPAGRHAYRLQVAVCWTGCDLAAIIACVTRRHRGLRVLEWAAKDCSDYCDALAAVAAHDALAAAWQAMVGAGGFHAIYLSHMRPGAVMPLLLESTARRPPAMRPGTRRECSLQVHSRGLGGAAWLRSLPKKKRSNYMRGRRLLAEIGPVFAGPVHGPAADDAIAHMIALKRRWLLSTGQQSALLAAGALPALVQQLRRLEALQVFAVTCGGTFVAGLINISGAALSAPFFSAYDPHFDRASPGTIVLVEHLQWAFDHDVPVVDYLCGNEEYKLRFANGRTELATYVGARTLLGRVALAISEWLDQRGGRPAHMLEAAGEVP